MLAVKLICVGKMRERFYIDAFAEYSKRLSAYCRFECVELAEQRLPEKPSEAEIEAALNREALEIEKQIPPDAYVVALCVEGKQVPSETIADLIPGRENSGKPRLCFLIGGSFGLANCIKNRLRICWTLPNRVPAKGRIDPGGKSFAGLSRFRPA